MDKVEQILSETADFLEGRLAQDEDAVEQMTLLLANGQTPTVVRSLSHPLLSEAVIAIRKTDY